MENEIESEKLNLWKKIVQYNFNDLVTPDIWDQIVAKLNGQNTSLRVFANKLKKKLGWEREFALKVIVEYKKFIYLGVISKYPVTPSKIIDLLWHEHLLFSASYRNFCSNVLEYNFDHQPELIESKDSTQQFQDQYNYTLALYKSEFGVTPPAEIWITTKIEEQFISNQTTKEPEFRASYEVFPLIEYIKSHYQQNYPSENIDLTNLVILTFYVEEVFNDGISNSYLDGGSDGDSDGGSDGSSGDSSSCGSCGGGGCGG
jgi:hypothetical protein